MRYLVKRGDRVSATDSRRSPPGLAELGELGASIELRPREFALLEYLMRNAGTVVSKTMILERVWDYSFDPQTNVVDVLVCRLRNKIDNDGRDKMIQTIRGMGYVLKAS